MSRPPADRHTISSPATSAPTSAANCPTVLELELHDVTPTVRSCLVCTRESAASRRGAALLLGIKHRLLGRAGAGKAWERDSMG